MAAGILGTLASVLLGIAGLLWWEATSWGTLIAWVLAMWAALFAAWGLLASQPPRLLAAVVAIVLSAASAGSSALWIGGGWWRWGIGCTIAGSATVVVGVWRAHRLLTGRSRQSPGRGGPQAVG
jgi:hypothetical protein